MAVFEHVVCSPTGIWEPALPIAASRAGALGLLNLTHQKSPENAAFSANRLHRLARGRHGLVLSGRLDDVAAAALDAIEIADTILLVPEDGADLDAMIVACRSHTDRIGLVATSLAEAELASKCHVDLIVAKGHEAGGGVGEETTFVLLQRLIAWGKLPVLAWGGIGLHTVAAAAVAGAAGVLLDWQFALLRDSGLSPSMRQRLANVDGSETATLRHDNQHALRFFVQPRLDPRPELERALASARANESDTQSAFDRQIGEMLSVSEADRQLWLTGQDIALAPQFRDQAGTVARALKLLSQSCERSLSGARQSLALREDGPLARSHGTRFPIVQGPMTHVSDVPEFCHQVAQHGGLPFLALALMRGPDVRKMLEQTDQLLGDLPWGVGILGFVPQEIRAEQMPAIEDIKPDFAIIAGGRPDQALGLESRGIKTYLHVPSPGMLETFLHEGARRFVFEGRECGGHVGPRTSFVLWESMISVLLKCELPAAELEKTHVLFAGGIHDDLSAAMVACLAQPLVERGIKFGVLLGTAYLRTQEIVDSGAVVSGFQDVTLASDHTVLVETGPGHAIRCADTDYITSFTNRKAELKESGHSHEETRDELERMNLGRLRMASKGIARKANPEPGESPYCHIDDELQRRQGMFMLGQVAALRHERCTIEALHQDVATGAVERLKSLAPRVEVLAPEEPAPPPLDIAIVGIGCLLPGATDPQRYWDNILAKQDLIQEIPAERFEVERWFDPDPRARDKIYSRWGGFVPEVLFDPLKYGIPPASLASIEPMQLMALELVSRALADAGYECDNPLRARTSVILGVGGGAAELGVSYGFRSMLPKFLENPSEAVLAELPEWTEDSFAGILLNVVAGRVANRFDLGGANFTVDAACASSLAAVYLACRELSSGACDMVVTGGCDTMQGPMGYLCFSKTGALSPRGRARPFDATADGIAISEGHAAVVLKRRIDAERDGDQIYAVIRGAAGGSDGRHKGLTAPRFEGQLQTLRRAYAQARVSPASVELFEAHGTGTAVGDLAECQALGALLTASEAAASSTALGSVKSMIGHTKCAAGVAGLIKAALALKHRVLPPTLHVQEPSAKAGLEAGPLYVNADARPWVGHDQARRAGVSAFGFGGSNFHVVLEEYTDSPISDDVRMPRRELPAELFCLAAASPERLAQSIRSLRAEIQEARSAGALIALADLAFTVHSRGAAGKCRAAMVATSVEELLKQLEAVANRLDGGEQALPRGAYFTDQPLASAGQVAFLFPGQGSQFPDMLRDLAIDFQEVRQCLEQADRDTPWTRSAPLSAYILPPSRFRDTDRASDVQRLKDTAVAQPALAAANLAMLRLLAAFDIRPQMTAGHSFGELVALHAADCFDASELFRLAASRGQAMAASDSSDPAAEGAMLAVAAPAEHVESILLDYDRVWLANLNSPRQTVLSGSSVAIDRARVRLEQMNVPCQAIPVACAFHTPLMAGATTRFQQTLDNSPFNPPQIPVFSNLTGAEYPSDPQSIRRTLLGQIESQVRFREQIENLYSAGARIFIEVGPGRVLSGLVAETLGQRAHRTVPVAPRGNGLHQWLLALAALYAEGLTLRANRLYVGRQLTRLELRHLASEAKAGPPKHTWRLNGSSVRPVGASPLAAPPRGQFVVGAQALAAASQSNTAHTQPVAQDSAPASIVSADLTTSYQSPGEGMPVHEFATQENDLVQWPPSDAEALARADAHSQFQQTMRQFLEVQRSVMLAYLGLRDSEIPSVGTDLEPAPSLATRYVNTSSDQMANNGHAATNGHAAPSVVSNPAPPQPSPHVQPAVEPSPRVEKPDSTPVAAPAANLEERLLRIVSQRTGYPLEMLTLGANLEADLGIDSIKRVEIISTFRREALPELKEPPATFMERMTAAKSMQAILTVVADFSDSPSPPPTRSEVREPDPTNGRQQPLSPNSPTGCPRCLPIVVPAPLDTAASGATLAGVWIITDDGQLAPVLLRTLTAIGAQCLIVAPHELQSPASALEIATRARAAGLPLRGVLHLAPLADAPAFPGISAADWRAWSKSELHSLLYLLQAVAPELNATAETPIRVLTATRGGGDFGLAQDCAQPWRGGLVGMLKTAAREWPNAWFRAIDFDEAPTADWIVNELLAPGPLEVGYRHGQRLTLSIVNADFAEDECQRSSIELNSDSVVLAIAGGKGITAQVCLEIAAHSKCQLVLLGRSPVPSVESDDTHGVTDPIELRRLILSSLQVAQGAAPSLKQVDARFRQILSDREINSTLAAIQSLGGRAEYLSCDASDAPALSRAVADIRSRHGRIDAVIHGAGIIEDRHISEKSPDSFDRVTSAKIEPLLTLSAAVDPSELKLLVLFSSVSGFFGNPGQVDYAAANEILNRIARRCRDQWPTKTIALNWGPWSGAGMVTPEVARQFLERGVGMVTPAAGRAAAWREIVAPLQWDVRALLGPGSWLADAEATTTASPRIAAHTPLLMGQKVRLLKPGELAAHLEIDASRHLYLRDHVIDDHPVLPLAFVLEMMAELVATAEPQYLVAEVSDLRQLKGIVFQQASLSLALHAERVAADQSSATWKVRLADPERPARPLYQATINMRPSWPARPAEAAPPIRSPFLADPTDAYHRWLFHGPLFQTIDQFTGGDDTGLDVMIRVTTPETCLANCGAPSWLLDPIVTDVAPQLAALWSRSVNDVMLLPSSIARFQRFAALGAGPVECRYRARIQDGDTVTADVWYLQNNQLLAAITGLECVGNRQLNRITEKAHS
jgi:acyl transferase domain-containing protein/NAD(P)H-dependent flavin oxidoreductase YrpB (nitropropane dioxygenase family)/NAD(P)-dependent dehydrogenase (short-subunit alcohol dehydrogenase family)